MPGRPGENTGSLEELLLAGAEKTGGVRLMTPQGKTMECAVSHSTFLIVGGVISPGVVPG